MKKKKKQYQGKTRLAPKLLQNTYDQGHKIPPLYFIRHFTKGYATIHWFVRILFLRQH